LRGKQRGARRDFLTKAGRRRADRDTRKGRTKGRRVKGTYKSMGGREGNRAVV